MVLKAGHTAHRMHTQVQKGPRRGRAPRPCLLEATGYPPLGEWMGKLGGVALQNDRQQLEVTDLMGAQRHDGASQRHDGASQRSAKKRK